jgi:uncharacterized protein
MVMDNAERQFACDAMLGGLARWLRAAGYDASWRVDIADHVLVRQAQQQGRTLLTSDTGIMEFSVIRDGVLPTLWIPHGMRTQEQLTFVLQSLHLTLRQPRCMSCGGTLIEVSREHIGDRVPARTLGWLDRFWECSQCRRVFWRGTHWQKIAERLGQAAGEKQGPPSARA